MINAKFFKSLDGNALNISIEVYPQVAITATDNSK